jgi:uncharacterized coiled-coil protein SlyX
VGTGIFYTTKVTIKMKNSIGNPGYDVPVNASDSFQLQHALIVRVRDGLISMTPLEMNKTTENHLIDAITSLDHLEQIRQKEEQYSTHQAVDLKQKEKRIDELSGSLARQENELKKLHRLNNELSEKIEKYEAELVTLKIVKED